jgi:hypothetical protein
LNLVESALWVNFMNINADICFRGIFPFTQQIEGGKYLWKLISDIARGIFGNIVEESHKLRDFTYGFITILPVIGTIFNLFLYLVMFQSIEPPPTIKVKTDSDEMPTPPTEEIEYSISDEVEVTEEERHVKLDVTETEEHSSHEDVSVKKRRHSRVKSVRDVLDYFGVGKKADHPELKKKRRSEDLSNKDLKPEHHKWKVEKKKE